MRGTPGFWPGLRGGPDAESCEEGQLEELCSLWSGLCNHSATFQLGTCSQCLSVPQFPPLKNESQSRVCLAGYQVA